MTFPKFACHQTHVRYVISDGGQHETTLLQCTQAVKRLLCVRSIWPNSASWIFFRQLCIKSYHG